MKSNYPTTSRREFLKGSLIGGAAALAVWRLPSARAAEVTEAAPPAGPATAAAGQGTSRVALAAGNDRANLAFKALEPFKQEIAAAIGNKRVILKPNNVIINRPLCATHADNLEGILEFLKSIGKTNVVIAESPAMGSALEGFSNYGYNKFVGQYGVKLLEIDKEGFEVMHCIDQTDFRPRAVRMSKLLAGPDNFVISAAVMKTHDLVGITLSLKNVVVGAPIKDAGAGLGRGGPGGGRSDKPITHGGGTYGINYNLFTLAPRLHPHLAVIDGFQGMEGTGPVNGTPVDHKVCVASLDWLAADRVAAELMGVDVSKIGYLTYCIQAGDRGEGNLSKIEVVGPALKDHIRSYQMPRNWDKITSWQQPLAKV
jgi:uncharacterized protein (DUF362 family)